MRKRLVIFIIILLMVISAISVFAAEKNKETITARQRDTILLMTAKENPNYDICLVVDVSGSMTEILPKLKNMANSVIGFSSKGDTLILQKFDDSPRKPLIQEFQDSRDIGMFRGWVDKTVTTKRFGTDIQAAYYQALKSLADLNEGRKKSGEPMRMQYIVFVSDGDDIPPAQSEFRNKGSEKSLELASLIEKAKKDRLVNIIPLGMEFKNYQPVFKRFEPGHIPPPAKLDDPELKKFTGGLKEVLNREPGIGAGGDDELVAKAPYQFLIDSLSGKLKVDLASVEDGEEKHSKIYRFVVSSNFRVLKADNLKANAAIKNEKGDLQGKITAVDLSSKTIQPGGKANLEVTVLYPQNWSFKKKNCDNVLDVVLSGDMSLDAAPGQPAYVYPFNTIKKDEQAAERVSPEKLFWLVVGLLVLSIIIFPAAFIYQVLVPVTVTIKSGDKAVSYRLSHKGKISIGELGDFEIPGITGILAEIQRRFRRFILVEKAENSISQSMNPQQGKVLLKLGEGFSLNISGTYREFEFLPGNREFGDLEEVKTDLEITDEDLDEGPGEFKF